MVVLVMTGLAAFGGAVFSVLDRPFARNRRGNTALSITLLAVSAVALLTGLAYAVVAWLPT